MSLSGIAGGLLSFFKTTRQTNLDKLIKIGVPEEDAIKALDEAQDEIGIAAAILKQKMIHNPKFFRRHRGQPVNGKSGKPLEKVVRRARRENRKFHRYTKAVDSKICLKTSHRSDRYKSPKAGESNNDVKGDLVPRSTLRLSSTESRLHAIPTHTKSYAHIHEFKDSALQVNGDESNNISREYHLCQKAYQTGKLPGRRVVKKTQTPTNSQKLQIMSLGAKIAKNPALLVEFVSDLARLENTTELSSGLEKLQLKYGYAYAARLLGLLQKHPTLLNCAIVALKDKKVVCRHN